MTASRAVKLQNYQQQLIFHNTKGDKSYRCSEQLTIVCSQQIKTNH
jgi:hypothetical protein